MVPLTATPKTFCVPRNHRMSPQATLTHPTTPWVSLKSPTPPRIALGHPGPPWSTLSRRKSPSVAGHSPGIPPRPLLPDSHTHIVASSSCRAVSKAGLLRDLNPGPLAPGARIMPLDQTAGYKRLVACRRSSHVLDKEGIRSDARTTRNLRGVCASR